MNKMWNKLVGQVIPFLAGTMILISVLVSIWAMLLCTMPIFSNAEKASAAVSLAQQLWEGSAACVLGVVVAKGADHYFQDKFGVDNEGLPHEKPPENEENQGNEA